MKNIKTRWVLLVTALMTSYSTFALAGQHFQKVVWITFENTSYSEALQQPDFLRLSKQGALLTNLSAEAHPSQGNYIAMIAGSSFNIDNDKNVDLNQPHIGDLLEKAGLDWAVFAENYPGNCFTGAKSGTYYRKHSPFISFTNVSGDAARCAKIGNAADFKNKLAQNYLPAYSMYVPDINNDGHNTGSNFAGKWLTANFGDVFSNPELMKDMLFVITFDESESLSSNQIYTVLLGGSVAAGVQNNQPLSHPAILKLLEDEWGLGNLGQGDQTAPEIVGIWK